MKRLRSLYGICFAIALLASCSFSVFAQSQTISGSVSDAITSEPLAGVSIVVVGSETESGVVIGTQTDAMGRFNLDVPAGFTALKFSYIGYISKDIWRLYYGGTYNKKYRIFKIFETIWSYNYYIYGETNENT